MGFVLRAIRRAAGWRADRSGLTLVEVLLSLTVFLIGAVSIVSLFLAASVLHAEAANRRTASFIAEQLLSEVKGLRFREVFARSALSADLADTATTVSAVAVSPDINNQGAMFDQYPLRDLFFPLRPAQDFGDRAQGPILIEGNAAGPGGVPPAAAEEWVWYEDPIPPLGNPLPNCDRGLWGTLPENHPAGQYILQPRTWYYVVEDQDPGTPALDPLLPGATSVLVRGGPANAPQDATNPGAPPTGYTVIDDEWIGYENRDDDEFLGLTRGIGGTRAVGHRPGTPVTVAREHPYYPGFYYAVQFYPVNATGVEAHVVVSVGYRTGRMFRTWTLRSIYTPTAF